MGCSFATKCRVDLQPSGRFWAILALCRLALQLPETAGVLVSSARPMAFVMHAGYLVGIAIQLATHHRAIRSMDAPGSTTLNALWVHSKARVNDWNAQLKWAENRMASASPGTAAGVWCEIEPLVSEALMSEVCTRVCCASLTIVDRMIAPGELSPIAHSIFLSHLEIRRRVLRFILTARRNSLAPTMPLNYKRQEFEQWTDLLLANLDPVGLAYPFAFDSHRVRDHQRQLQLPFQTHHGYRDWEAAMGAIRLSLAAEKRLEEQPSAHFNSQLVDAMLACFPQCVFDGSGQPRPLYAFSATASHAGTDKSAADVIETLFGPYSVARLPRERRIDYRG